MENKILNVGVISCSGMAENHMKAVINNPAAKLIAVCDTDIEKAKTVAARRGVAPDMVFADYRDLLKIPELDAVIIVTPDQLHREMSIAALEAGKHVLCEKPLALTREDCEAIAEATRKTDKKFMVGQICRYTPGFKAAKALIDKGEIGELMFVESEYAHDYERVLTPDRKWRLDPLRNGVVGGGCHAVDLLRWIVGKDPVEVKAYSTKKIFKDLPYDDTHIAIMQFPDGIIGKVFISISCKRAYTMRSVFYGTKGTVICDNTSPEITVFRKEIYDNNSENLLFEDKVQNQVIPVKYPVSIANHNTFGEFDDFCKIIMEDLPVKTTVFEGAKSIATCFAIVEAADTGKTVVPNYEF